MENREVGWHREQTADRRNGGIEFHVTARSQVSQLAAEPHTDRARQAHGEPK